ncbi:uncharacterized protein TrAtP1_008614 [Trichoderma atroviride]|uniref:uncharacterized protein n=1 Tax=Hypocrea atroviridis TaxID=63577 RepID=UPI00331CD54C|nr:hypothetical protein TrAtP1_008614 [Trichoderma atroviride]
MASTVVSTIAIPGSHQQETPLLPLFGLFTTMLKSPGGRPPFECPAVEPSGRGGFAD